jgi:hypothetical protein
LLNQGTEDSVQHEDRKELILETLLTKSGVEKGEANE